MAQGTPRRTRETHPRRQSYLHRLGNRQAADQLRRLMTLELGFADLDETSRQVLPPACNNDESRRHSTSDP